MAAAPALAMATAIPTRFVDIPRVRDAADHSGTAAYEAAADALLALPNSVSPELVAHTWHGDAMSPPPMTIEREQSASGSDGAGDNQSGARHRGIPLSMGALSSLDEAITITPAMLARQHLPKIMLGQGPVPIRDVLYELTQTVPGFSRIPPAKARRIVVAALEKPSGGGVDGEVAFDKIGWGKWHAHIKGSPRDSGVGSYPDGGDSPERHSERSDAASRPDSAVHMGHQGSSYNRHHHRVSRASRDYRSGHSWTGNSSLPEEDESGRDVDMDMDVLEEAAEKMSLDGDGPVSENPSSSDEETDDEDWAASGIDALRKASLPTPNVFPPHGSRGIAIRTVGGSSSNRRPSWTRRRSSAAQPDRQRFLHSSSVPHHHGRMSSTPEERAAMALMSLGSM